EHDRLRALNGRLLQESISRPLQQVHGEVSHGPKAAAHHKDRSLVSHLGRLYAVTGRREHRSIRQLMLDKLQAYQPVVDPFKYRPRDVDYVDIETIARQSVRQRADQHGRVLMVEEGPINQVDAEHAERLLLKHCSRVEQMDVEYDLR